MDYMFTSGNYSIDYFVRKPLTSPPHPQFNGIVEKFNRALEDLVVDEKHKHQVLVLGYTNISNGLEVVGARQNPYNFGKTSI